MDSLFYSTLSRIGEKGEYRVAFVSENVSEFERVDFFSYSAGRFDFFYIAREVGIICDFV